MTIPYGWLGSRRKKLMAGRGLWPGLRAGQPAGPPEHPAIRILRGMDSKAGSNGTNIGARLPIVDARLAPIVATTSSYTVISGTAAHWNLPTNGSLPTPTSTGTAARLNGGPYVFAYEMSDGAATYTGELTIERDLGRSIPGYSYWRDGVGLVEVADESFTAACYSISTTAEYTAVTTANMSGATILIDACADPDLLEMTYFNRAPVNPGLITSENWDRPSRVGRITVNQGGKQRYYRLAHGLTGAQLQAKYSNMIALNVLGNATDVRFIDCDLGAPSGSTVEDYPYLRLYQATDAHFIGNRCRRYRQFTLVSQTRPVIAHSLHDQFAIDAFFFGQAANELWVDGTYDDILIGRSVWPQGDMNHPDAGQFLTTATAGQGIQLTGHMSVSDVRSYLANSTSSWNGFHGAFSGSGAPKLQGTYRQFGGAHVGLTTYAMGHLGNADYNASVATELIASTAVRALTGVTGSIGGGKSSGAQGFDTWSDDGLTAVPNNNQRYPGHNQTAAWPAGANLKVSHSYFDGVAPALVGTMDISTSLYKGRGSNSTDTAGLTPAQINDNSAYFSDPNRVVDWAGRSLQAIDAIHSEMYRPKAGGPLDNGDGTYKGRWLPSGKVNQLGRATLSAALDGGVVTVSLSVSLAVDVICDVLVDGNVAGTITIPAGQTVGTLAVAGGDITIRNDSGLVNPAGIAG